MKNLQRGFVVPLLIFIILASSIVGGYFYFHSNKLTETSNYPIDESNTPDSSINSTSSSSTASTTIPIEINTTPNQPLAVFQSTSGDLISYYPRTPILKMVAIQNEIDWGVYLTFYKFGVIVSGPHKGGELIVGEMEESGPCKGPGCGHRGYYRFMKLGDELLLLSKISAGILNDDNGKIAGTTGLRYSIDYDFEIPIFKSPVRLYGSTRQVLDLEGQENGRLEENRDKVKFSFPHPLFGQVYMSANQKDNSYLLPEYYLPHSLTVIDCYNEHCFLSAGFFAFRPDGTFLKYSYKPDFGSKTIDFSPSGGNKYNTLDNYAANTECTGPYDSIEYTNVLPPDPVLVKYHGITGYVTSTGDWITTFKTVYDSHLKDFYEYYKKNLPDWNEYRNDGKTETLLSYEQFVYSYPLFIWQDPFGRLIRFNAKKFLPPSFCEPIIYLYPKEISKISVSLGNKVDVTESTPEYKTGWNIIAGPDGKITDTNGIKHPYLFWEGKSYIFPIQKEGFVVKKLDVPQFLKDSVEKLGLNSNETNDFLKAWLPAFNNSPYYFITFIDPERIDQLAPLDVNPKPDTVIRILMDYKELKFPIKAPLLDLSAPPKREGFTVVEWGGLKR